MKTVRLSISLVFGLLLPLMGVAAELRLQSVAENIYAIVGEMEQRSPDNLANNATFGLAVTGEGLVLVDPGGSERGAAALERVIRRVSDLPVRVVINTGGQDHRWLGNHYWQSRGARIIASEAAVADQQAREGQQLTALTNLIGEEMLAGTEPVYADTRFSELHRFSLGGTAFEIHHAGQAHTPGDSFVWLPQQKVLFSGDIVYHDRLLGVGPQSHSGSWLKVFDALAALEPEIVVPGHGVPGDLAKSRRETADYLRLLRARVGAFLEGGGGLESIRLVDQSEFSQLGVFDQLAVRNAHQVYQEMEFE